MAWLRIGGGNNVDSMLFELDTSGLDAANPRHRIVQTTLTAQASFQVWLRCPGHEPARDHGTLPLPRDGLFRAGSRPSFTPLAIRRATAGLACAQCYRNRRQHDLRRQRMLNTSAELDDNSRSIRTAAKRFDSIALKRDFLEDGRRRSSTPPHNTSSEEDSAASLWPR